MFVVQIFPWKTNSTKANCSLNFHFKIVYEPNKATFLGIFYTVFSSSDTGTILFLEFTNFTTYFLHFV